MTGDKSFHEVLGHLFKTANANFLYTSDPQQALNRARETLKLDPVIAAAFDQAKAEANERLKESITIVPQDPTDLNQLHAKEVVEAKLHEMIDSGEFAEKLSKPLRDELDRAFYGQTKSDG